MVQPPDSDQFLPDTCQLSLTHELTHLEGAGLTKGQRLPLMGSSLETGFGCRMCTVA